jgi:hypothetical protein
LYQEIVKCGSTNSRLSLYANSTFDGTVDYLYIIPITTPVAHCTGSQSAASVLYAGGIVDAPSLGYKNVFTVDNRSAGGVRIQNGAATHSLVTADDDYQRYLVNTNSAAQILYMVADPDFVGDITALSVKEVTRHAQGTMLLALTPGWDASVLDQNTGIVSLNNAANAFSYYYGAGDFLRTNDGSFTKAVGLSYTANTTYLIAVQWGDTISNVNYSRIGAVAIASPWTSGAWGSDAEFDGAYTLGTDLNLFYSKFGSNNLRELRFYDRILDDRQIEVIRRSIQ